METKLKIIEIEKFAVHDGPGIRTVIFTKGCPLKCEWCANPESQSFKTVIMHNHKKCLKCLNCLKVCEHNAIRVQNNIIAINHSECIRCKKCTTVCLTDACYFSGESIAIAEIVKEVCKDKLYYDSSGGGVTISGGEALMQVKAVNVLIDKLKKEGIDVAIETCGAVKAAVLRAIVEKVDLVMFDLKHIDKYKYEQATKGEFELMINNFLMLSSEYNEKTIIRVPVIPEFNEEDLYDICDFVASYKIAKLVLLPFHNLGKEKYKALGSVYKYAKTTNMSKECLNKYIVYCEKYNLEVSIGG